MASTPSRFLTVEEFERIPNPPGGRYELHHGGLVKVSYPKQPHVRTQWQIRVLLAAASGPSSVVRTELPFRPLPEYECWGADVALLSRTRWDSIEDWLSGVPELVVEVLSPSHTAAEMRDKEQVCLENGAIEFWLADPERRQVRVSTCRGCVTMYKAGEEIPLYFGGTLTVDDVFA